jgi:hypothetical protein
MASAAGSPWNSRVPQVGQKEQSMRPCTLAARLHCFGLPAITFKSPLRTMTEMPKAEAACFWHSRQWQT